MAAQVLALVAGIGEPLLGTVLTVDAVAWTWDRSTLRRGPASVRPAAVPGVPSGSAASGSVAFVSVAEVADAVASDGLALVDVRTPAERAVDRIPGSIAPDELRDETDLVVVCERGPRAVSWAAANAGSGRRIRVLDGGMRAWRAAGGELVAPISNPSG
jgi:adenylyltransferase/sulfurtransferase